MILGIDVGGTNTDAVLLDRQGLVASAKVITNHDDLLSSVYSALEEVLKDQNQINLDRLNLSTTLCTNAIVQNELEEVGILVSAGPGIDPENYRMGNNYYVIPGALDHRGTEIKALDVDKAKEVVEEYFKKGLKVFSVVEKFSTRNPDHEKKLAQLFDQRANFLTMGHTLSGQLNFPRRIATSYYNSAIWPVFNKFANSIMDSMPRFDLSPQLNILKADGGTMPFVQARKTPVESIFSGPAASIMGIIALCEILEDAILLDIGGTTTDVGVFAGGSPLIEAENVELEHRPTLVRAMKNKSIGLGGDSGIVAQEDSMQIGPKRYGPCLAMGGPSPTVVDALNCVKCFQYGDVQASNQGMSDLAEQMGCSQEEVSWKSISQFCQKLRQSTDEMLKEINERPVYTVHELLDYRKIKPQKIYIMGGPAQVLAPYIKQEFGLPVIVPDNYEVANAIGAAIARPTRQAELFADTEKRTLTIPELEVYDSISGSYSLDKAKKDVTNHLSDFMKTRFHQEIDPEEVEIIEESSMNMVKGAHNVGQDIRVKCQIKPGIAPEYKTAVRCLCKEL